VSVAAPAPVLRPAALITGASSGIGAALAHEFARNGHQLALVARRGDRLEALADALAAAGHERPLVLAIDLASADISGRIATELAAHGLEPQYVVNNAGFGLLGEAAKLDRAKQIAMIDINVRVVADLSLAYLDSLSRHRGGILNMGSVASFLPGPGMAVYYATKAFVLSLSEALHQELAPRGIRVTAVCPGPVQTEFQKVAGIGTLVGAGFLTWTPERIAAASYAALMRGQRVLVPGLANRMVTLLPRFLPRGMFLNAVARSHYGLARPSDRS
jgi:short-subunit dehydrogenase